MILTEADAVPAGDELSLTLGVKVKVPALVGVPEIAPLLERDTPGGNWPDWMVQE